ncbi:MAG: hypothetical protein U1A27_13270 [Phycisphaerae bacterium]
MTRFAGDFCGPCRACDDVVEFAIGFRPGTDPIAMHFGPGGATPVEIGGVELGLMADDVCDLKFWFICPLCGRRSTGRATCRATPSLGDALE